MTAAPTIPVRLIVEAVSAALDVRADEIIAPLKKAEASRARKMVCWLARRLTKLSTPAIGRQLGGRDHTTILHAVNAAAVLVKSDAAFAEAAAAVELALIERTQSAAHDRFADIDAIETARFVMRDPMRHAVRVSVNGVMGMAALLIDCSEIVQGLEEFFEALDAPPSKERDEMLAALEPMLRSCVKQLGMPSQPVPQE